MKAIYARCLLLCLLCFYAVAANAVKPGQADSPLFWQLTYHGVKSYALGSVHLGEPSMYPLPQKIMAGYEASQTLIVEVNMDNKGQGTIARLSRRYGMDSKRPLLSWLSPATQKQYQAYCQRQTLPCEQFAQFKPWLVSVTFASLHFMKSGYDPELGIDRFFIRQAKGNKPVIELETPESQFQLFANLSASLQEDLLLQSMSEDNSALQQLMLAWRQGDEKKLIELFEQVENPALKQLFVEKILIKRNHQMAAGIFEQLKLDKRLFVVMGTAHLIGQQNILELLQKNGVGVSRIK